MKKRINIITGFVVAIMCAIFLVGCGKSSDKYADYAKVIYHLEDGEYKGSKLDVTMYYPVEEGQKLALAKTIDQIDTISPPGTNKVLGGWYKTKTENGYQDLVDAKYEIGYKETLDLYAKWKNSINNKFVFKAKINNEDVVLTTAENYEAGSKLNVSESLEIEIKRALKEHNLTYIKEFEVDSKKYDKTTISEITMPETDSDFEYVIYVDYIVGNYYLVSNPTEFKNAMIYISDYDGIYLMEDINLNDYADLSALNSQTTTKELIGNGHTITYTTNYQQSYTNDQAQSFYEISIFHNATNINVHDVNFEVAWYGRSKDVPVLVTGLALTASNSKFANINISYTYNSRNENDTEGKANDVYDVSNSQNYEVNNVTITYKKK